MTATDVYITLMNNGAYEDEEPYEASLYVEKNEVPNIYGWLESLYQNSNDSLDDAVRNIVYAFVADRSEQEGVSLGVLGYGVKKEEDAFVITIYMYMR